MSTDVVKQIGLQREAWGPRFWTILHRLAERSGYQEGLILNNDEADAWIVMLKAQAFVMPCLLCKQHYQEWMSGHRFERVRQLLGDERRAFLRQWLWGCHNRVNTLNQKSEFPLEACADVYKKASIQKEVNELYEMFKLAMTRQALKPEDVARWKQVLVRLRGMAGI